MIAKSASVKKKETKGEIITELKIPIGITSPNKNALKGKVEVCAESDALKEELIFSGINEIKIKLKKSEKSKIPAKAP